MNEPFLLPVEVDDRLNRRGIVRRSHRSRTKQSIFVLLRGLISSRSQFCKKNKGSNVPQIKNCLGKIIEIITFLAMLFVKPRLGANPKQHA
jgi:hypothetical protein